MTSNLEESIIMGTLAISGFDYRSLVNFVIAYTPSIIPSSKFISRT